jgi:hypothetical protein
MIRSRSPIRHTASPVRSALVARSGRLLGTSAALCLLLAGTAASSALASSTGTSARTRSIVCRGGGNSCTAVVSLAGGASNVKLRIALSDTDLKLAGRAVKPGSVRGAYSLSHGAYSLGGSLYTVTLNAVQSIPKGSTLTLKFAAPTQSMGK